MDSHGLFGANFSSPPGGLGASPDTNMYTMDGMDDNSFSLPSDSGNPPFEMNDFLNSDVMTSPEPAVALMNFGAASPAMFQPQQRTESHTTSFQPRSVVSSASPESSSHDSSSDSSGRRKRKSPSESSPGLTFGSYRPDAGLEMARGKRRTKHDSPVLKLEDASMGMLNNSMTQSFSIQSAANSPPGLMGVPSNSQSWNMAAPYQHNSTVVPIRTKSPTGYILGTHSTDNTPPSVVSFESPNAPFMMMRDSPDTDGLTFPGHSPFGGGMMENMNMFNPMPAIVTTTNAPSTVRLGDISRPQGIRMHVSPLGHKSRVETQIPVKITLDPCPPHIKKMHLPTETIAKAKFLAKETPTSSDTIELHSMVVCASAMNDPKNKAHALQLAAAGKFHLRGSNPRRGSDSKKGSNQNHNNGEFDPNDPDSPLNGGPVRICDNCVSRERKRAGRKKAKKQEDEERWHEYERDRIVMFNTTEYLEMHPPSASKEPGYADNVAPQFSPDARQVDAPMRIVCYCRHQQEKVGFQVIFTAKDYMGRVLAQTITDSILITDDHKTHTHGVPSTSNAGLAVADPMTTQMSVPAFMGAGGAVQPHGLPGRAYHSSTNLAGMGNHNYWNPMSGNAGLASGQRSTTSMTPRNLSRPASPTGYMGPKKKRKGSSGQHKIPADLMMTRSDLEPISIPKSAVVTTAPSMNTLVSPQTADFNFGSDLNFAPNLSQQNSFQATPPTPEASIAGPSKAESYFYSAPNSAHASRAASPTSFARQQMGMYQPTAPVSNSQLNGMTFPHTTPARENSQSAATQASPIIYKIRPEYGPMTGNIEVVILGKGFDRSLEVRFGNNIATSTTFWNEDAMICLLPPTLQPGPVPVSIVHPGQRGFNPQVQGAPIFTYTDDTRNQLFELAIQLQCAAQLGPNADYQQFAQQIVQGAQLYNSNTRQGGFGAGNVMNANTEQLILAIINKVDLIDSPYKPYYDHRREGGSTMLALACRLGFEQLVAGLLARGADFDVADAGGFTPLMLASACGHTAIVRRLILRGADPSLRNLRGITAAEFASSSDVRHYVRHRRHYRSKSEGVDTPFSLRSRANSSAESTRSLWGPPSSGASSTMYSTEDESAIEEISSDDEDEVPMAAPIPMSALASRRQSLAALQSRRGSEHVAAIPHVPETAAASTIAVFSAWRDQLTAQINALQQNLGNMQLSDLLAEQNLPALSRRFSQLMPTRRDSPSPPRTASPTTEEPPPPYHEACPDGVDNDYDTKVPEVFTQQVVAESSRTTSASMMRPVQNQSVRQRLQEGKLTISKMSLEEAAELRRMREEGLKGLRGDANLWVIWFPLLIMMMVWYVYFGMRTPPVMSWVKSFNTTIAERFGQALPSMPGMPERLRLTAGERLHLLAG